MRFSFDCTPLKTGLYMPVFEKYNFKLWEVLQSNSCQLHGAIYLLDDL